MVRARSLVIGLCIAVLIWGCSNAASTPQADLYVAVSTDIATLTRMDGLRISATRGAVESFSKTYDATEVSKLPDVLLLHNGSKVDDQGNPITTPVSLDVVGLLYGQVVLDRTATFDFDIENPPALLRMPLCADCIGVMCMGMTCRSGKCVDPEIETSALPVDDGGLPLVDPECPNKASSCSGACSTAKNCGDCPTVKPMPLGSYSIDAKRVTNDAYAAWLALNPASPSSAPSACAKAESFAPDPTCFPDGGAGAPTDSVTCVDWCSASAYCRWAGEHLCGAIGGSSADGGTPGASDEWANACQKNALADLTSDILEWEDDCAGDDCNVRSASPGDAGPGCSVSSIARAAHRADVGFRCCSN